MNLLDISGQIPLHSVHDMVRHYARIGEILDVLRPYDCGVEKVRIGGRHDGGYVMLPPVAGDVAYSLGVSDYSPWDWDMAERGIPVYQYDGTIDAPPDVHPNLFFRRHNIIAPSQAHADSDAKTLAQIIQDDGHTQHDNLILQIDVEGAEWAVFAEADAEQLNQFKQIIVEWHGLSPLIEGLDTRLAVLRKMLHTHLPVHVHINNYGLANSAAQGLVGYGDAYEVSYVRRRDFDFRLCTDSFPTPLDAPCRADWPEVALGAWQNESS